ATARKSRQPLLRAAAGVSSRRRRDQLLEQFSELHSVPRLLLPAVVLRTGKRRALRLLAWHTAAGCFGRSLLRQRASAALQTRLAPPVPRAVPPTARVAG